MKKVFLVRKDVTMPYGEGNWQIMTFAEFKEFKKTDQAQGRKFIRMFQKDQYSDLIIKECEPDEARKIKTALQRQSRHQKYAIENGFVEIPYSQVNVDDEIVSSEELIPDETQDVEEMVEKKLLVETLHKVMTCLSATERRLINQMFLQDEPLSERQLAMKYSVSSTAIHKRKVAILKKLKTFLKF